MFEMISSYFEIQVTFENVWLRLELKSKPLQLSLHKPVQKYRTITKIFNYINSKVMITLIVI